MPAGTAEVLTGSALPTVVHCSPAPNLHTEPPTVTSTLVGPVPSLRPAHGRSARPTSPSQVHPRRPELSLLTRTELIVGALRKVDGRVRNARRTGVHSANIDELSGRVAPDAKPSTAVGPRVHVARTTIVEGFCWQGGDHRIFKEGLAAVSCVITEPRAVKGQGERTCHAILLVVGSEAAGVDLAAARRWRRRGWRLIDRRRRRRRPGDRRRSGWLNRLGRLLGNRLRRSRFGLLFHG